MPHRITDPRERAEAQLRITEERFRQIFENAAVGIAEVGADGRFVMVNGTLCEITGYSRHELLQRSFQDITHPDDLTADLELAERLARGELQQYSMEKRYIRKDGEVVFVNLSGSAVRSANGEFMHYVAVVEDITDRKRAAEALRQSEQQFRSVFEHAATGIAIADMDGQFMQCNPAYEKLVGYTEAELHGMRFGDLVHPDDRAENMRRTLELRRGLVPHFEIENRYVRRDGSSVWVRKFLSVLHDDQDAPVRVMALVSDITSERERQQMEREAMRQKDEFIAVLAHELRNPLAPIRTSVAVLRTLGATDPALERCRDVIDRQVTHMARLIDDLLDVSRLSRGELRLQRAPASLGAIVTQAIELAEPFIHQQRQRLVVGGPPDGFIIDADAARLTQVLGNLLHNAAKYSPPDTEIHLTVAIEDGEVVIAVRDQGLGIPASQLTRVFDLFAQTDNARELSKGGLGIGLALAKRLVDMHGGSITACSDGPGRGSTFTVRLPAATDAQRTTALEPSQQAADRTPPQARRVLVADDNADAAEMIAMLFELAGCEVRQVHDGESAVLEAERFRPDLVILDIGMPGMDGHEACQQIRRAPWGASMTVVALTGRGQDADRQLSALSGFDQHFVKPVDTDALLHLLQR